VPFADWPGLDYIANGQYSGKGIVTYVGGKEVDGLCEVITIPAGERSDLASCPRICWAMIPPFGIYEQAAYLHDWLCSELNRYHRQMIAWKAGRLPNPPLPPQIDAVDTDGLFRRVMREGGVGFLTRWVMYVGVRWGALANPARRAGWWRTAPAVLTITAIGLAAFVAAVWGADRVAHWLIGVVT
jgi:hypothetical protein